LEFASGALAYLLKKPIREIKNWSAKEILENYYIQTYMSKKESEATETHGV